MLVPPLQAPLGIDAVQAQSLLGHYTGCVLVEVGDDVVVGEVVDVVAAKSKFAEWSSSATDCHTSTAMTDIVFVAM